jgi:hypothetical protein
VGAESYEARGKETSGHETDLKGKESAEKCREICTITKKVRDKRGVAIDATTFGGERIAG